MYAPPRPKRPRKPVHPAQVARLREGSAFNAQRATDVTYAVHKRLRQAGGR